MALESASGPWEMWPAILRRPASIFTCLNHISFCAYPMYNVSVYYCMLVYLICLIVFVHSLEWITTLMAFPAYHSFGWWGFPLKCGISALRPTVCVCATFDHEHSFWLLWWDPLAFRAALRNTDISLTLWLCVGRDHLSSSIWSLSPKSSRTAARMSCVRNVSVFFSRCWESILAPRILLVTSMSAMNDFSIIRY